jgi:hypothetical protein
MVDIPIVPGTEQGLDADPARRASDGGRRAHHRRWPLAIPQGSLYAPETSMAPGFETQGTGRILR